MSREFYIVIWLFGCVTVFVIVAVCMSLLRERLRSRQLMAVARSLGLSFQGSGLSGLSSDLANLPVFVLAFTGHGRIRNIMRRSSPPPVLICDCHYWTGSGNNRFDHRQTVFCFEVGGRDLPDFTLRPQANAATRKMLGLGMGFQQATLAATKALTPRGGRELLSAVLAEKSTGAIDFPEEPEFARRYLLQGTEADRVRQLFRSGLLDFFARQSEPLPWIEKAGTWFVVYGRDHLVRSDDLANSMNDAILIQSLFGSAQRSTTFTPPQM
jgi:hypothetical protein